MRAHLKFVIAREFYMEIVLVLVYFFQANRPLLVSNIEREFCRYKLMLLLVLIFEECISHSNDFKWSVNCDVGKGLLKNLAKYLCRSEENSCVWTLSMIEELWPYSYILCTVWVCHILHIVLLSLRERSSKHIWSSLLL